MNKLVFLTLIVLFNVLLSGQDNSEKLIDKQHRIKITPLYTSDLHDQQQSPTLTENTQYTNNNQENSPQKSNTRLLLSAEWILDSSMENAPELLKGIFLYLQSRSRSALHNSVSIPSFHRFILLGPPGSGKTTLAHAIAYMLNYSTIFVAATSFLGRFRNETANNVQAFLKEQASDGLKKVIIIDELHKLFEHHANDQADDSQTAAAFWLTLDYIERHNPNIIIIGTANNVDKLPPEIKSRFSGKIITVSLPDKNQKIQTFKNSIAYDQSVELDKSVNDAFIAKMIQQVQNCSLRDVQLIIDTAKIFSYAEKAADETNFPITLTKVHFQRALDQLQTESQVLQESFSDRLCKSLQPWSLVFAIAANGCVLLRASYDLLKSNPEVLKKIQSLCYTTKNLFNNNIILGAS